MIDVLIAFTSGVAFSTGLLLPPSIVALIGFLIVKGFGK
jgi:hypothetical protein